MKLNQCKQHKNHSLTATKGSGFFTSTATTDV